jgi:transcriptional regulator with XRE-family HTH domain
MLKCTLEREEKAPMSPDKEVISLQIPKDVLMAVREHCAEAGTSLNQVISYHFGEGLKHSPFPDLLSKIAKHCGTDVAVRKLQSKKKRGRPTDNTYDLFNIARMQLKGYSEYKIAREMGMTYSSLQWALKRDAYELEEMRDHLQREQDKAAAAKARVADALAERERQRYEREMKALAEGKAVGE